MNKYLQRARQMREQLNNITSKFTDEEALNNKDLYQNWSGNGIQVDVNNVFLYNGELYRVIQSHTTQNDWTPDVAVSLYAKILVGDEIKEWEQPDSTNAYMIGDKVYFPTKNDSIYESLINNNVWSPAAYPAGWKIEGDTNAD